MYWDMANLKCDQFLQEKECIQGMVLVACSWSFHTDSKNYHFYVPSPHSGKMCLEISQKFLDISIYEDIENTLSEKNVLAVLDVRG